VLCCLVEQLLPALLADPPLLRLQCRVVEARRPERGCGERAAGPQLPRDGRHGGPLVGEVHDALPP
jgi:hypothetical protein